MDDIWQEFHRLPRAIRDAVATPAALATVDRLEQQHPGLDLANFIMRTMVKEFPVSELAGKISDEAKLSGEEAAEVVTTLQQSVFSTVQDYLQGSAPKQPAPPSMAPAPPAAPPVTSTRLEPIKASPTPPRPALNSLSAALPVPPPKPPSPLPPLRPLGVAPKPARPATPPRVVPAQPMTSPPILPPTPAPPVATPPLPRPVVPAPPPGVSSPAPTQEYSEEDAKEIEAQSKKLKDIGGAPVLGFEAVAQHVMEQHRLAYPDELLTKRALTIFKSRLKDIRDSQTTTDVLMRDPKVGGLGMDPDMAANVVRTLEEEAVKLKSRGMVEPPKPPSPLPPPLVPKVEVTRPEPKPPLRTQLPPPNLPVAPVPETIPTGGRKPPPLRRPADIPAPPPMAAPRPAPAPVVQRSRVIDRPQMSDISRPSQTYGPAEEMQSLTLVEFRRLGTGAGEATRRLLEKMQHWKNESFKLWAEAVAGWRLSEVHQLYLTMGRQSLEQNRSIKDIVQQRAKENLPYLSEHEFTIVADFNRQLHP